MGFNASTNMNDSHTKYFQLNEITYTGFRIKCQSSILIQLFPAIVSMCVLSITIQGFRIFEIQYVLPDKYD